MTFKALFPSLVVASGMAIATAMPATAATLISEVDGTYEYAFENVNSDNTIGDSLASAFTFKLESSGTDSVNFLFSVGDIDSFSYYVSQIYFSYTGETESLLSSASLNISNIGQVSFVEDSGLTFLDGLQDTGFDASNILFGATYNNFDVNRIDPGDTLGIQFSGTLESVVTALESDDLRIGINAGLPDGQSDSYVTSNLSVEEPAPEEPAPEEPAPEEPAPEEPTSEEPTQGDGGVQEPVVEEVPEPLTILGSGLAIGFGAWFRRKNKQA